MKPTAFWTYSLFGGFFVALVLILHALVFREPTPEYAAHVAETKRIRGWYAERGLNQAQIRFDEALAAASDGTTSADPTDRALVAKLRQLVHGESPADRAKSIGGLLLDDKGRPAAFPLIDCPEDQNDDTVYRGCKYRQRYASLGNPERLAILLSGDAGTIATALPAIPADVRAMPSWPPDAPRYRNLPAWSDRFGEHGRIVAVWTALSIIFVSFFAAAGAFLSDGRGWGPPIAGWPHFALGWAVMLAAAPGFLTFKTLRVLTMDLAPAWKRLVRALTPPPSFKSEYERVIATLTELRERAAQRGSEETVRFIDGTLAKVREAQDHEELEKLRKVAEDIRVAYEARLEIEQALS